MPGLARGAHAVREGMKILVSKFNMIGDVVLSTALLRNLRIHYPDAHITYTTYEMNRGVLQHNTDVDVLHTYDRQGCSVFARGWNNLRFFFLVFAAPARSLHLPARMFAGALSRLAVALPAAHQHHADLLDLRSGIW